MGNQPSSQNRSSSSKKTSSLSSRNNSNRTSRNASTTQSQANSIRSAPITRNSSLNSVPSAVFASENINTSYSADNNSDGNNTISNFNRNNNNSNSNINNSITDNAIGSSANPLQNNSNNNNNNGSSTTENSSNTTSSSSRTKNSKKESQAEQFFFAMGYGPRPIVELPENDPIVVSRTAGAASARSISFNNPNNPTAAATVAATTTVMSATASAFAAASQTTQSQASAAASARIPSSGNVLNPNAINVPSSGNNSNVNIASSIGAEHLSMSFSNFNSYVASPPPSYPTLVARREITQTAHEQILKRKADEFCSNNPLSTNSSPTAPPESMTLVVPEVFEGVVLNSDTDLSSAFHSNNTNLKSVSNSLTDNDNDNYNDNDNDNDNENENANDNDNFQIPDTSAYLAARNAQSDVDPAKLSRRLASMTPPPPGIVLIESDSTCPDTTLLASHPSYTAEYPHLRRQIYYEVTVTKIDQSSQGLIAMGYACKPYPTFRLPGWHRGSLSVHSDDGRRYVCSQKTGFPFIDPIVLYPKSAKVPSLPSGNSDVPTTTNSTNNSSLTSLSTLNRTNNTSTNSSSLSSTLPAQHSSIAPNSTSTSTITGLLSQSLQHSQQQQQQQQQQAQSISENNVDTSFQSFSDNNLTIQKQLNSPNSPVESEPLEPVTLGIGIDFDQKVVFFSRDGEWLNGWSLVQDEHILSGSFSSSMLSPSNCFEGFNGENDIYVAIGVYGKISARVNFGSEPFKYNFKTS